MKIRTLLIANRGEIACRIIRTAKRLEIKTVAVFAYGEEDSLHCQLADEALCIGPANLKESYLNADAIIQAAQRSSADAIHPGYGFLAENAQFAQQCQAAGIIFVGPSATAIAQMAVKDQAKKVMKAAGVPTLPWYRANDASIADFPVLLKPAKGGGGKGMRIVTEIKDLADAIAAAQRESLASFGDDTVFIEKYLPHPRHIEVQIFRDQFGQAVHLFARDCSLQRRHQKIVEEAPAIEVPILIQEQLFQAALNAAHAIDYEGAGTVEFLYADKQFYFMEMNTRLQVEHPVTEMITGLDLVEWQLRIASGESLPLKQMDIQAQGHAIEARIYAEDPSQGFLPATGTIQKMILPPLSSTCRIDSGIQIQDKITIHYDPLLAKVICHGINRSAALKMLATALAHYQLFGITTNLAFLRNILQNKDFIQHPIDTQFLETHLTALLPPVHSLSTLPLALLTLVYLVTRKNVTTSPWLQHNAWRLNLSAQETLLFHYSNITLTIQIQHQADQIPPLYHLVCPSFDLDMKIAGHLKNNRLVFLTPASQGEVDFYQSQDKIELFYQGQSYTCQVGALMASTSEEATISTLRIQAPMSGIITQLWVKPGDEITLGSKLLALEAMKMEHTICATQAGKIKNVYFQCGDQVQEGSELLAFEE